MVEQGPSAVLPEPENAAALARVFGQVSVNGDAGYSDDDQGPFLAYDDCMTLAVVAWNRLGVVRIRQELRTVESALAEARRERDALREALLGVRDTYNNWTGQSHPWGCKCCDLVFDSMREAMHKADMALRPTETGDGEGV